MISMEISTLKEEEENERDPTHQQSWLSWRKYSVAALPFFAVILVACAAAVLIPSFLTLQNGSSDNVHPRSPLRPSPTTNLDGDMHEDKNKDADAETLEEEIESIDYSSHHPFKNKKKSLPFSTLDPVKDLKVPLVDSRPFAPGKVFSRLSSKNTYALPTNKWYQNMLLIPDDTDPNAEHSVYTIPHVVDAMGPVPGIRIHASRVSGSDRSVQVVFDNGFGLTLGAARDLNIVSLEEQHDDGNMGVQRRYGVDHGHVQSSGDVGGGAQGPLTDLGLTLRWEATHDGGDDSNGALFHEMTSSIVRGMAYGTMHYRYDRRALKGTDHERGAFGETLPTVVAEQHLLQPPVTDSGVEIPCKGSTVEKGDNDDEEVETFVGKSVEFSLAESDFTWVVFYSHPVHVRCYEIQGPARFVLQVTRLSLSDNEKNNKEGDEDTPSRANRANEKLFFTSRVALMNNCTSGKNPSYCSSNVAHDASSWSTLVKKHADVYPGKNANINYRFTAENTGDYSFLQFDWDARRVNDGQPAKDEDVQLLMYSLPHHREILYFPVDSESPSAFGVNMHCTPSLNGQACAMTGSTWVLKEDLNEEPSFRAPRPPFASALPPIAKALEHDIKFTIPTYFARGAGDTYFSGKMLAKLARILLVAEELYDICSNPQNFGIDYVDECENVNLPSSNEFEKALDHLRSSTEVWINGTAETPFVFDATWGGLLSCGCIFDEATESCRNSYPNCPALVDEWLNFGNGFYNDHHFHYGYHIYAAAAVAHFDPDWGKDNFENVLLLIRDVANPSSDDKYFPMHRMKDWYLGNSWASGIVGFANGRNQESSSEAIAAYEAISLFGTIMVANWAKDADSASIGKAKKARLIKNVGRILTATEVRSADRYWHVRQTGPKSGIYPEQYKQHGVGILWNMMAQFQTWFGAAPYLAYGIQLLPLTPISERRDDVNWAKQLYSSLAESCRNDYACDAEGWGVLQNAILATIGHPHKAIEYAANLPEAAYESAGGNGHSRTNSIWYYASRPKTEPLHLRPIPPPTLPPQERHKESEPQKLNCGCPETCTVDVLHLNAGGHTCGDRIRWCMDTSGLSEYDACSQIGGIEYPDLCSGCDPTQCIPPEIQPAENESGCPSCPSEICKDKQKNQCPVFEAPFLCLEGEGIGGCSAVPWTNSCSKCCQLTYKCL